MFFLSLFAVALAADSPCVDEPAESCPEVRDVDCEGGLWLGGQGGVVTGAEAGGVPWGGVAVTVRADALFSVQLTADLMPALSESQFSSIASQSASQWPSVVYDRSPIGTHSAVALRFAPFRGVLLGPQDGASQINLFGLLGAGVALTSDRAFDVQGGQVDRSLAQQLHPTLELGLGADIRPARWLSVELEGRRISYVEQFVLGPPIAMNRWLPAARASVRL